MAESNQTNKYAYLSRLSTKELEAILRADAESPKAGNDEAISYILEVIEQREREHPSGSFPAYRQQLERIPDHLQHT